MKKVYIFPRYSGNENSDWYKKLKEDFQLISPEIEIIPLSIPNWDQPTIEGFLQFISTAIPVKELDVNTFFVSHSIGCKAAMIYINKLYNSNPEIKIGGLMCVAGWWKIDKPWLQLKPWINFELQYQQIKTSCNNNLISILSDNDPFTSDFISNKNDWENLLNAKVILVPKAKHFNEFEGYEEIKAGLLNLMQ